MFFCKGLRLMNLRSFRGGLERVRRTLMEMWHDKHEFRDSVHREQEPKRFVNFYNTVKPHAGLKGLTPFEALEAYFYPTNGYDF